VRPQAYEQLACNMRVEAYCTARGCDWFNRAYSDERQVPLKCPQCKRTTVHFDVRYKSDINGNFAKRRSGERRNEP
jgi:hypothetical protein